MRTLPESIQDTQQLESLLSEQTAACAESLTSLSGDWLVLGAGGKMGPSLTRMLGRALQLVGTKQRVIAVSRFSTLGLAEALSDAGIETITGYLLEPDFVDRLPEVPNVVFMTGAKFGTSSDASRTWAMNTWLLSVICQRFRSSRIVAFSTGNVYPLVSVEGGGSVETDLPFPIGEYAMSALGRERTFECFSRRFDTPQQSFV